jgi:hypothetical protein
MKRAGLALGLGGALCFLAPAAAAHKASDSYLYLERYDQGARGRWDIALRDLNDALELDQNRDGQLTWGELLAAEPRVDAYARARLHATTPGGACATRVGPMSAVEHSDGAYAALTLSLQCPGPASTLSLRYDSLFDVDAQHRGVVRTSDEAAPTVFTKSHRQAQLDLTGTSGFSALYATLRLGVEHILSGYDHLLFLLALLLPAALRRRSGGWVAVPAFGDALGDVLRVVTAFTLAHSLTLGLAAAGLVMLPSRFVESAIAFSVVLAAANNVFPRVGSERWLVAFGLGLLHGFGFAATLSDVGLSTASFMRTLFGFNLGVELGQLAVVLLLLPLLYGLRRSPAYRTLGLRFGSAAVALVACVWLVERAFDLRLIS